MRDDHAATQAETRVRKPQTQEAKVPRTGGGKNTQLGSHRGSVTIPIP